MGYSNQKDTKVIVEVLERRSRTAVLAGILGVLATWTNLAHVSAQPASEEPLRVILYFADPAREPLRGALVYFDDEKEVYLIETDEGEARVPWSETSRVIPVNDEPSEGPTAPADAAPAETVMVTLHFRDETRPPLIGRLIGYEETDQSFIIQQVDGTFQRALWNDTAKIVPLPESPSTQPSSRGIDEVQVQSTQDNVFVAPARTPSRGLGTLAQIQILKQGDNEVDYLEGAGHVAVSPDGKHVYVTAGQSSSITTLARDASTGQLTLRQTLRGMVGMDEPGGMAIAPRGDVVYVASSGANESIAVLSRNLSTGDLKLTQSVRNGEDGVMGLVGVGAFVLSNDGRHLYHVSSNESPESALTVFACDEATGQLSFVQAIRGGERGPANFLGHGRLAVSPGGRHVYVIAENERSIAVYRRNRDTGTLEFAQILRNGEKGISGLDTLRAVVCSRDGKNVYTLDAGSISTFSRDYDTGKLSPVQVLNDGMGSIANLGGAFSLAETPAGEHLYVVSLTGYSLNVFARDDAMGTLRHIQHLQDDTDGVDGLGGPFSITVSPDGRHVYVATGSNNYGNDNALAVFARERGAPFADANLETAVRDAVGKSEGFLTDEDLLGLTELRVPHLQIQSFSGLEFCSNVELFEVGNVGIEADGLLGNPSLAPLTALWNLRSLHLGGQYEPFDSEDLVALASLPNISDLGMRIKDNAALQMLEGLPRLVGVNLSGSLISDEGVAWLVSHFPSIDSVGLCDCPNVTDKALKHLSALPQLVQVDIRGAQGIGIEGVRYLCDAPSFRRISFRDGPDMTDATIETLSAVPQLAYLGIWDGSGSGYRTKLTRAILDTLKSMKSLKQLELPIEYCAKLKLQDLEDLRAALPDCTLSVHPIADFDLYKAIRTPIEAEGKLATWENIRALKVLEADSARIDSLQGIERLTELERIEIGRSDYTNTETRNTYSDLGPLQTLPKLRVLHLDRSAEYGEVQMAQIGRIAQLQYLSAGTVTESGLNRLSGLEQLVGLDINLKDASNESLKSITENFPQIGYLNLDESPEISDAGVGSLLSLRRLAALNLAGCPLVTDAGIAQLKALPQLAEIGLPQRVNDNTIQILSQFPALETIMIWESPEPAQLTSACLETFKGMTGLKRLRFSDQLFDLFSYEEIESLQKALPDCELLNHPLSEKGRAIPDPNLEAAIREALGKPEGNLTPDDLLSITVLTANNQGIEDLSGLEYCRNLELLDLYTEHAHSTPNRVKNLEPLAALTKLRYLQLYANPLDDAALEPIRNLTALTTLMVGATEAITDAGMVHLAGLTELEYLSVDGTHVTDEGLMFVKTLPNLRSLDLGGTAVRGKILTELPQKSQLERLSVNNMPHAQDIKEMLGGLSVCTNLESLDLSSLTLEDEDVAFLAELPKLEWVGLTRNMVTDKGLKYLKPLSNLKSVDLQGTRVTMSGVAELQRALPDCTINIAHFPDPNLDAAVREQIGKLDGELTNEDLLNVTKIDADNREIQSLEGIQFCPNLVSVSIAGNNVKDLGPLAALPKLKCLQAYANPLEDAALEALAGLTTLSELFVGGSQGVTDAGMAHVSGLTNLGVAQR